MVAIPTRVKKAIRTFIARIEREAQPEVVLLYGSYVRGRGRASSDVDLAVFSRAFERKNFIDSTSYLFSLTSGLDVDLQPVGFPYSEYQKRDGEYFVDLIKKEGLVVYKRGKFTI